MHFQLRSIVLWPRTEQHRPRVVEFAVGKLNVIAGAPKTGKSAVIPIIDYCLGSERCAVPVTTIRDACSWFGIVVRTGEGEKLFARREPRDQQSTGDMFMLESSTDSALEIPTAIAEKNTNVDAVKRLLDRLAGLSNLGFDPTGAGGGFKGRPSFRDLLAFTFQPQNIVANPDVLFFRADTMEHKEKLRTIFPYVLGAVTPELLARRWELDQLQRELNRSDRELNAQRQASAQWRAQLQSWVSEARDLGLLSAEAVAAAGREEDLLAALTEVVKKTSVDAEVTDGALDAAATEAAEIEKEESAVTLELAEVKARADNMLKLRTAVDDYTGALKKQRERLQLSRWLRDLADSHKARCPVCGGPFGEADEQLNSLCDALAAIEATARRLDPVPAVFDRELVEVREQVRKLSERLKGVRTRREAVEGRSARIRNERWRRSSVDRFIGRMEQALQVLTAPQGDPALAADVEELKRRIADVRAALSDEAVRERQRAALQRVAASMARALPELDAERPDDPAELNVDDLTIRVTAASGRSDFLWEIGSGANWLSYHVAAMLGLHELFLSQKGNPVPSLLVLDQPSQVYFPRKLARQQTEDVPLADEDVLAVRKVFDTLGRAVARAHNDLQILVFDHAGMEVWGEAPNVHLVEEWRGGNALVPKEWLSAPTTR